jgi:hypothetical protein
VERGERTYSGKVGDDGDVEFPEEVSLADAGTLEYLRGTESAGGEDDELACADDMLLGSVVATVERVDKGDADRLVSFEEDPRNLGVALKVEVLLELAKRVDVGWRAKRRK